VSSRYRGRVNVTADLAWPEEWAGFGEPVRLAPTITYANCTFANMVGYRPLQLDLHLPGPEPTQPGGHGPYPLVIWIHGGGWREGSRQWMPGTVAPFGFHHRLLARGYAIADVDYRLALEAPYPAQLSDVQAAIRWLRHYADRIGLDPGRFGALGESAGGHLAAMAGLLGHDSTAVQAVVNWYGVADLDFRDPNDPDTSQAILLGGPIAGRLDFVHWASPLSHVHAGAPPFLNMHGAADTIVPCEQSERLTEALRAVGVRCDLRIVPDAEHCFGGYADIGGLIDESIDFLEDVLK
jgi:acetyl esterase/lipase